MKCCYLDKPIFKDVVIVGNGPSGIFLSLMLDGWTPFITTTQHPDEFFSTRLEVALADAESNGNASEYGLPLVHTDLLELAQGLDGRTTNPVSLLYDALMRPYADMGMNMAPLVKWRRTEQQFNKYGHHCEVESQLKELKVFQEHTNPLIRFWYDLRCVNETSWEGNQFLRSQLVTDNEHYKHVKHMFLIHPYSKLRTGWEIFMSIVFLLEFVTIPLELASLQGQGTRKIHMNLTFAIFRFALDIFCVCDIIMNFCTGYIDKKKREVIMEPLKIIRWNQHYVQTYFAVDLCSSIPGSVIAHLTHSGRELDPDLLLNPSEVNMFEIIVVHISMFKILRLFTFLNYCRHFMKLAIYSAKATMYLRLIISFVVYLLLVHYVICTSISVSYYTEPHSFHKENDIVYFNPHPRFTYIPKPQNIAPAQHNTSDEYTFSEYYIRFFYATMIMWTRTGSGFRIVRSAYSQLYICIIWFLALIFYFIFIAYIMGVLSSFNAAKHKYIEMVQQLREYMRYKQLPEHLQRRLIRNYEYRFQKTYFRESVIMKNISGHIRQEIVMHSCRKLVENVVFFKNLPTKLLVQIVSCMQVEIFLENDVIARANTVGTAMYFIATGTVAIYTINGLEIDHLVLGKGPPGGSWHSMDPQILTLSLASWMALPGLPFTTVDIEDTSSAKPLRASAQQVASYYENYVKHMDLEEYFRSNVIVTQIRPVEEKFSMISFPRTMECESEWVHRIKYDLKSEQTICTLPEYKMNQFCTLTAINNALRRRCMAMYSRVLGLNGCNKEQFNARASCIARRKIYELIEQSNELYNLDEDQISVDTGCVKEAVNRGRSFEEDVDDVCVDCLKERAREQDHIKSNEIRVNRFCRCLCNRDNNYRRSTKKRKDQGNEVVVEGHGDNRRCCAERYNKTIVTNRASLETNNNQNKQRPKWLVDIYDKTSRVTTTYTCNTLILANGAHDLPNKLSLHRPNQQEGASDNQAAPAEPNWLLHDVRSLEIELDLCLETQIRQIGRRNDESGNKDKGINPVLVVGAGLSAADAILATRKRNIPVLHVFRSKSSDLIKKLPKNMYPEYHKIHQMMMQEPATSAHNTSPNYTPFPAHTISAIDAKTNTVTIVDQHTGQHATHRVSFAAVLIGSRPDLGFLPPGYKLGKRKTLPVDSKTNTVNIDRGSHVVSGFEGLYAVGPLAGDNFVRFLPGGCLAAVADLYRKRGVNVLD